jgi:hypothetical protein
MSSVWRHLPPAARPIAAAVSEAVPAARQRDTEGFAEAVDYLAGIDAGQVGLVVGTLVRLLMEDLHPDGLDADDVREVLKRTVLGAARWQPDLDPQVVLILLAGALGVYDPEDGTVPPKPDQTARHGMLLVAELIGERPVDGYLNRTFSEIERTQLND